MSTIYNRPSGKGMIFAGCSFTWGQGLYFYSNLETLINQENKYGYGGSSISLAQHKFKESIRFPRKVAEFFGSYEIVHPENSGANDQIVNYWETCLESESPEEVENFLKTGTDKTTPMKYGEISHVFFQLTHYWRDKYYYEVDDRKINVPLQWNYVVEHQDYKEAFEKYLLESGLNTGEVNKNALLASLDNVKRFLKRCEENGIKTYIIIWPSEYLEYAYEDEWLCQRWIKMEYKNRVYPTIHKMIEENKELSICEDLESFEIPPNDCHPSLSAHNAITLSIINFLANEENKK
jgi:hypothetical protein